MKKDGKTNKMNFLEINNKEEDQKIDNRLNQIEKMTQRHME